MLRSIENKYAGDFFSSIYKYNPIISSACTMGTRANTTRYVLTKIKRFIFRRRENKTDKVNLREWLCYTNNVNDLDG